MKKSYVLRMSGVLFLFLLVSTAISASDTSGWKLKSLSDVKENPGLVHLVWESSRPPYGALDSIKLHRVVRKDRMFFNRKVIFMIPGTWNSGGWSEITDSDINPLLYLAKNSYDVYTMDFRCANIQDMSYEQFAQLGIDISGTADWTYGVYREDMKACVDMIMELSPADKIFMSGFSRGVMLMYIYASKYQDDLKGLVALDGPVKDTPPTGTKLDEATYNHVVNLFKSGLLVDPASSRVVPWLYMVFFLNDLNYNNWKLAGVLPYSKRMVGGTLPTNFEFISDYVADNAYHLWDLLGGGEGVLTGYNAGYIDREVLVKALNEFSRYYPYRQSLEDAQMQAYDNVPYLDYDDNDIYLPMIAFLSRVGCSGTLCLMDAIPNMTLSSDVTINFFQEYGHVDILYGKYALTDVKQPLLNWLDNHMGGHNSHPYSMQSSEELNRFMEFIFLPFFQAVN